MKRKPSGMGWLVGGALVAAVAVEGSVHVRLDPPSLSWGVRNAWSAPPVRVFPLYAPDPDSAPVGGCGAKDGGLRCAPLELRAIIADLPTFPFCALDLPDPVLGGCGMGVPDAPTPAALHDAGPSVAAMHHALRTRAPHRLGTGARRDERDTDSSATDDEHSLYLDGTLDPIVFAREVSHRRGALTAAYQRALRRSPELEGTVLMRFTIDRSGAAEVAVERDGLDDAPLSTELVRIATAWRFPAPPSGTMRFSMPIEFHPPR